MKNLHKNTSFKAAFSGAFFAFLLFIGFLFSNLSLTSQNQGKIQFEKTFVDLGDVTEGQKISHEFTFKNTGGGPVIIQEVKPVCGCTVAKFTKRPVKPGESGVIKLTYNSSHQNGYNQKAATVKCNVCGPEGMVLTLRVYVIPKN